MLSNSVNCFRQNLLILRVLLFSLIAAPVWAQEISAEPQVLSEYLAAPTAWEPTGETPAIAASPDLNSPVSVHDALSQAFELPPEVPPVTDAATGPPVATAPFVGDACHPNYWIVSSRCAVQSIHELCRGPWNLQVYQRLPDGRLIETTLDAMSAQLVPGIPVCLFSHGSFVEWESQCREAHSAYIRIRSASAAPLQMIFFTWPSNGPYTHIFPLDVVVRGRQADFNGFHMAATISKIPDGSPISLIGHSHGARVVLATMQLAGGGDIEGYRFAYSMGTHRYRVILAAAALDHDWLNPGQQYQYALNPTECLLNLRNRHDYALSVYPLHRPFARRAAARSGFTERDRARLGYNAQKLHEYDVTSLVGKAHLWPEYYKEDEIISAMTPYVYFY